MQVATLHRRLVPLRFNVKQVLSAQPRAQLDGLEVKESSFGEWLAAGGDRRSQPRAQDGRRK